MNDLEQLLQECNELMNNLNNDEKNDIQDTTYENDQIIEEKPNKRKYIRKEPMGEEELNIKREALKRAREKSLETRRMNAIAKKEAKKYGLQYQSAYQEKKQHKQSQPSQSPFDYSKIFRYMDGRFKDIENKLIAKPQTLQPVQQPIQQPMQKPAIKQPVQQPVQKPMQKPMQQPTIKPSMQQPMQKPIHPPTIDIHKILGSGNRTFRF